MPKISEAGREILKKWQKMGIRFSNSYFKSTIFDFTDRAEDYSIPEQPVPDWVTLGDLENMQSNGLNFKVEDVLRWTLSIPAQPIPKELLVMEEPKKDILIHHIPERKLWLVQREAGTNEQWQKMCRQHSNHWFDIPVEYEPEWYFNNEYRVKPKTVKYYFCCYKDRNSVYVEGGNSESELKNSLTEIGATIIGNIEERDVEV